MDNSIEINTLKNLIDVLESQIGQIESGKENALFVSNEEQIADWKESIAEKRTKIIILGGSEL